MPALFRSCPGDSRPRSLSARAGKGCIHLPSEDLLMDCRVGPGNDVGFCVACRLTPQEIRPNARSRSQQRRGMDRLRAVGGAQADRRGRLRLCAGARRGVRLQGAVALRPRLFPPQGRQGGARRRDLEGRLRPHAGQAGGGPRSHRVRQAHHLRRLLEIPDRDRHAGARRRRRADEAAGGAQEEARRRRPVRRGAQAAHAVPAERDRRGDLADRRRHPRHSASAGRPLPAPRAGVAGAGAGRGFGRRGRRRHPRLQRAARARRRCRGPI